MGRRLRVRPSSENKRYYLDLNENHRDRYLKVDMARWLSTNGGMACRGGRCVVGGTERRGEGRRRDLRCCNHGLI